MKNYFAVENKKKFVKEILMMFAIIVIFFIAPAWADTYQSYYCQYATVSQIEDNEVFFVDAIGDIWSIYDNKNTYHKDETVAIKFYNNHTDNTRLDDEIVKVTKVKHVKGME